jgi:hypothetical protein
MVIFRVPINLIKFDQYPRRRIDQGQRTSEGYTQADMFTRGRMHAWEWSQIEGAQSPNPGEYRTKLWDSEAMKFY